MIDTNEATEAGDNNRVQRRRKQPTTNRRARRRRLLISSSWLAAIAILTIAAVAWLGSRATVIKNELEATTQLIPLLKENIAGGELQEATATADQLRSHTAAAREAAGDPLWTLASAVPGLGNNFSAIAEVAQSADDVATL